MPDIYCEISFAKKSFYAGETANGTVSFDVEQVTPVKRVVLHIIGLAHWRYHLKHDVVKNETNLFSSVHLIPTPMDLPCGNHKYGFDFRLPTLVPSSQRRERIARTSYEISYKAEVIFVRPGKTDSICSKNFSVVSGFNLNLNRNLTVPHSAENAEMTVKVARTGCIAGDEIPMEINLKNPNDDRIQSILCFLYKVVSTRSGPDGGSYSSTDNSKLIENEVKCSPGKSNYENKMIIPKTCMTPSSVGTESEIIDIQYKLTVQIKKNSSFFKSSSPEVNIPIKVGLIPISNTGTSSNEILTTAEPINYEDSD